MPAMRKQTEPIDLSRLIVNKQIRPGNPLMKIAAFADFLLRKEQI